MLSLLFGIRDGKVVRYSDTLNLTKLIVKGFFLWKLLPRAISAALTQSWDYPVESQRQRI